MFKLSLDPPEASPRLAVITIDREGEKVNTIAPERLPEIETILNELEAEPGIQGVVLISGKKDTFVAGADVETFASATSREEIEKFNRDGHRILGRIAAAKIPIVAAISKIAPVRYAEIVAAIASRSAGPGTRANIDEFTQTTARAIEAIGGAERGKAIIILNPAEPPLTMRDTVFCLCDDADPRAIQASVRAMVGDVQRYVPGFRLKHDVQIETVPDNAPILLPDNQLRFSGLKVSVFLEVEGASHYLPSYAGNLDIMTSAALRTAEYLGAQAQ